MTRDITLNKANYSDCLWPAFSRLDHPLFALNEVTFTRGKGSYLFDGHGRRYFDGFSSLWTNLVGHSREEIVEVMSDQLRALSFMHVFSGHNHEPALHLAHELVQLSPFDHRRCFFGTSGSDATETAMKMARAYWFLQGRLQKNVIVGRYSEYHGTSMGALSLMGWDSYQKPYNPLVPRTYRLPAPNCYHCPWKKNPESCQVFCKDSFRSYFEEIDAKNTIAAILIEPVVTSDGLITPPPGYWEEIQKACKEYEVLLIADEVSTGMGRTGALYAATHFGLHPDITYLAKSLTSGYAPLSAVLTSEEIFQVLHSKGNFFSHGTTFGGHPVACVAALKVLEIIRRDRLVDRAQEIETLLFDELCSKLTGIAIVGNIRGKGALFEIELVANKETKELPVDEVSLGSKIFAACMDQGQYLRCLGRFICIAPPLIATDEEIKAMVIGIREALLRVMQS